jgi:ribosome biogenesis GTPase
MAPAGVIERRNGEQLLLHECLNCGKQQPNRVAADDNPLLLMRLAPVAGNRPEPAQEVDRAKSKKSA